MLGMQRVCFKIHTARLSGFFQQIRIKCGLCFNPRLYFLTYNAHIRAFSNKNFPLVLMSGARDKHESNRHSLSHTQLLTEEKCQRKITR